MEEVASHLKSSRAAVRNARVSNVVDKPTAKRLLSDMEEYDADILKERAALAKNRVKLQYAILAHPTHAKIGEAYLSAIVERLPNPAGATTNVQGSRDKTDQEQYRSLLIQAYSPMDADVLYCPVSHKWHDEAAVIASHIVPYAIGEVNISYVFGLRPEEGYEAIWSERNGLLLHKKIEQALDAAQLVIVPVADYSNDFKAIVLDEGILPNKIGVDGLTFSDFHDRTLNFVTEARPGKRNLYFHCLISLFRRFRYGVRGRGKDQEKIQMGKVWGTPGKWMSQGILRALAYEIGDIMDVDEVLEDTVGVSSFAVKMAAAEEDRKVAVQVREKVEGPKEWDDF